MPMWNPPAHSPAERAAAAHQNRTKKAPAHTASAPGTWVLIGENVDHFGGVTIMGLSSLRAAASVSPREDGTIALHAEAPYAATIEREATLAQLGAGEIEDPLMRRITGLVQTLIHRQVLSRDTAGLDITVVSDVPMGAGLGALYAADAAIALALAGANPELNEPPMRARLAEICSHAAATYSSLAVLRARHTVALRGAEGQVSVVDYADGSVAPAPHPGKLGVRIFSVSEKLGLPHGEQREQIALRRDFIDAAVANFGVASLRELPDNVERVVDWVQARRDTGDADAPEPATARQWVQFCESETLRSMATAKALRSRRGNELFTLLNSPNEAHDIATPDALVALALERGAVAARPAAAGTSQAVIAFVPVREADGFAHQFAEDFEVVEVVPGAPARVEEPTS
ncbi:galactokinase family protein [Corynebacterium sp. Q4381]|uniref:galactokinase family protein n=1 Tax=Corynebacterium sp. Marseille-Q4381 TaxID=3121597 RepID=UPI002FE65CAB